MPDPGLTDLIAAHQLVSTATIFHRNGMVQRPECKCGELMHWAGAYPAHVALVVEQHTNGRITELEARIAEAQSLCHDTGRYNAARQKHWNIRVFACDVLAALKGRAALEGEQQ